MTTKTSCDGMEEGMSKSNTAENCSAEEFVLEPTEITYRCEGGCKISLAVKDRAGAPWVICLHKKQIPDLYGLLKEITCYGNHVIAPLLGANVATPLRVVRLPDHILPDLLQDIELQRPEYRRRDSVEPGSRFGLCMPDACFITPKPSNSLGPCFCVEIKPKTGYVGIDSEFSDICRFCMRQRVSNAGMAESYWECSSYCPVDLYSGCKRRMILSLRRILDSPRNNIRFFRDGSTVSLEDVTLDLRNILSDCTQQLIDTQRAESIVLDLVYDALVRPLGDREVVSDTAQYKSTQEHLVHIKAHRCLNEHPCPDDCSSCLCGAPADSVIDRILRLQMLFPQGIDKLWENYEVHTNSLKKYPHFVRSLCLSGNYHNKLWQEILNRHSVRSALNTNVVSSNATGALASSCSPLYQELSDRTQSQNTKQTTLEEQTSFHATLEVARYIVCRTMKDCSIMITFEPIQESRMGEDEGSMNEFELRAENTIFLCRVTVIDLDQKDVRLEKHYKIEKQFLEKYKSFLHEITDHK